MTQQSILHVVVNWEVFTINNACVSSSVCLSTCISQKLRSVTLSNFSPCCPVAVARSSVDALAIRYVLPVLAVALHVLTLR